jgi:hypothetical protein
VLVAAAVCPHPPLLVPELASAAAAELDELRTCCLHAVDAVAAAVPEALIVIGAGEATRHFEPGTSGSMAHYGVDIPVALPGIGVGGATPALPLPLAIGAWLLAQAGWTAPVRGVSVAAGAQADECAAVGRELAATADRTALLVMGDGTACRSERAPRPYDERAAGFDASAVQALGDADPAALLALEPQLAAELSAQGRAAWQVLAGAADDAALDAEVLYDRAPYGVGYVVAIWERHG